MKSTKRICDEPLCEREAQIFIARKDKNKVEHLYCSGFCAQQDSPRRDSGMASVKTVKSLSEEHIETSPDISSFGSMIKKEPEIRSEPLTTEEMRKFGIIEIRESTLNKQSSEGNSILNESESVIENEVLPQLQAPSIELSPISEEEKFRQESLIESSIRSTHELAKNVMDEVKTSKKIEPALVNAACNAVKQMHSLLKLRLDIHKEMKSK